MNMARLFFFQNLILNVPLLNIFLHLKRYSIFCDKSTVIKVLRMSIVSCTALSCLFTYVQIIIFHNLNLNIPLLKLTSELLSKSCECQSLVALHYPVYLHMYRLLYFII